MNRVSLICGITIGLLLNDFVVAETTDDQPKEIPLDTIWAAGMPGTQSVRKLEPNPNYTQLPTSEELIRDSLVARIQHILSDRPIEGEKAGEAFVVVGGGKDALKKAADVLSGKAKPPNLVPTEADLTLVFYSYRCGRYVRLDSVERTADRIVIKYRFVSHRTSESTTHFALIPLGKMRKGAVQVEIKQLPPTTIDEPDRVSPMPDPQRIVCDSFSFRVGE